MREMKCSRGLQIVLFLREGTLTPTTRETGGYVLIPVSCPRRDGVTGAPLAIRRRINTRPAPSESAPTRFSGSFCTVWAYEEAWAPSTERKDIAKDL